MDWCCNGFRLWDFPGPHSNDIRHTRHDHPPGPRYFFRYLIYAAMPTGRARLCGGAACCYELGVRSCLGLFLGIQDTSLPTFTDEVKRTATMITYVRLPSQPGPPPSTPRIVRSIVQSCDVCMGPESSVPSKSPRLCTNRIAITPLYSPSVERDISWQSWPTSMAGQNVPPDVKAFDE